MPPRHLDAIQHVVTPSAVVEVGQLSTTADSRAALEEALKQQVEPVLRVHSRSRQLQTLVLLLQRSRLRPSSDLLNLDDQLLAGDLEVTVSLSVLEDFMALFAPHPAVMAALLLAFGLFNQERLDNPPKVLSLHHVDDTLPALVSESSTPVAPSAKQPTAWVGDSAFSDLGSRRDQQRAGGSPTQHQPPPPLMPPPPPHAASMFVTTSNSDAVDFAASAEGLAQEEEVRQVLLLGAPSAAAAVAPPLPPPSPRPSPPAPWRPRRRQTGAGVLGELVVNVNSLARGPALLLPFGEDGDDAEAWASVGADYDSDELECQARGCRPGTVHTTVTESLREERAMTH